MKTTGFVRPQLRLFCSYITPAPQQTIKLIIQKKLFLNLTIIYFAIVSRKFYKTLFYYHCYLKNFMVQFGRHIQLSILVCHWFGGFWFAGITAAWWVHQVRPRVAPLSTVHFLTIARWVFECFGCRRWSIGTVVP